MTPPQRVHIIGATGSGKTTSAMMLSKELGLPVYELDNVMWSSSVEFSGKNPPEIRDEMLSNIVSQQSWVVEGVYYKWVATSLEEADLIIYIDTPVYIRDVRIVKRFVKQRLRIERSNYKQTLNGLWKMLQWNHKYDKVDKEKIMQLLERYQEKVVLLKHNKDLMKAIP
ncbi:isopentenyl transferase family protein [Paenibacillus marinisediminis]